MLRVQKYDRPFLIVRGDSAEEIQRFHDVANQRSMWCRGAAFDAASLEWRSQCNKSELALAERIIEALNRTAARQQRAPTATTLVPPGRTWTARIIVFADADAPATMEFRGKPLRRTGYGRPWVQPETGMGDSEFEGMAVRYAYYA